MSTVSIFSKPHSISIRGFEYRNLQFKIISNFMYDYNNLVTLRLILPQAMFFGHTATKFPSTVTKDLSNQQSLFE